MRGCRTRRAGLACTSTALLGLGTACSDSSGLEHNRIAAPADNVTEIVVDSGPPQIFPPYFDGLFATVTVCVPATTDCQSIDHVLVDTGSTGLRLLGSVLTLSLPAWTDDASGLALAECEQLVSGSLWGPLRSADFSIANEQVKNLAIQVIEESTYPMPADCTGTDISSPDMLGANGIVGVATFLQDCGLACAQSVLSGNPGLYYACSSAITGGCQVAAVPPSRQVLNPVSLFSQDNNGTIIELPAVSSTGAPSVVGSLVFGIGTRDNNGLDRATVIRLDSTGGFLTQYPTNGRYASAFVDSGSNGIFFLDSGTTNIPTCSRPLSHFYCPGSTLNLSAKDQDMSGVVTVNVKFRIANAVSLVAPQTNFALDDLGGPSVAPSAGTSSMGAYFDWGLPFYFGRNVFTAIEDQRTPAGMGPFVAF